MADDLGEHDNVAERGDLDNGCTVAGVTDEKGANTPAVFTTDFRSVPMILPCASHQGVMPRTEDDPARAAIALLESGEAFV